MNFMTIGEVAKKFKISPRMLRYYDSIGLLPCLREEGNDYRLYDENAVVRLQQILVLRSLRISFKKIVLVLEHPDSMTQVIGETLQEINIELESLASIRRTLCAVSSRLCSKSGSFPDLSLFQNEENYSLPPLSGPSNKHCKEETFMNYPVDTLPKKELRILYLPPFTVAASQYIGENPEEGAFAPLDEFIKKTQLYRINPGLRIFGFNNPCPQPENPYGYEFWVTIPTELEVPSPLVKKDFSGGLYAARHIHMGDFQEWSVLSNQIEASGAYRPDPREPLGMGGCLEEHLNAYFYYTAGNCKITDFSQLDLLSPVKEIESR